MTLQLEDLNARAMFYEFTADEELAGASWSLLSESDKAGWRRVAAYVDRVIANVPAPELSDRERAIVERFEAAPYPAELLFVCPSYSHGEDGWHCAVEGQHDEHRNAAGDVTWKDEP